MADHLVCSAAGPAASRVIKTVKAVTVQW